MTCDQKVLSVIVETRVCDETYRLLFEGCGYAPDLFFVYELRPGRVIIIIVQTCSLCMGCGQNVLSYRLVQTCSLCMSCVPGRVIIYVGISYEGRGKGV